MKTIAAFATTAGACAFVAVVAAVEPASAGQAITLNRPAAPGQQIALPDQSGADEITLPDPSDSGELAILANNGPSLDGQQAILPVTTQQISSVRAQADGPAGTRVRR